MNNTELNYKLLKPVNPEFTFVQVDKCKLWWEDLSFFSNRQQLYPCKGYYAIVDTQKQHIYTTATEDYVLFHHSTAFHFGKEIASKILGCSEDDIICHGINHNDFCAVVEYSFSSRLNITQPDISDGWIPMILVGNSYNKTKTLECRIGFVNVDIRSKFLIPKLDLPAKAAHCKSESSMKKALVNEIQKNSQSFLKVMDAFWDYVNALKKITIAEIDMLPLFCKIQRLHYTKDMIEMKELHLRKSLTYATQGIKYYTAKYGCNAYTMLMVIADYIENMIDEDKHPIRSSKYVNLGEWIEEFAKASHKEDFSAYEYIGKEAYDTASWFGRQPKRDTITEDNLLHFE